MLDNLMRVLIMALGRKHGKKITGIRLSYLLDDEGDKPQLEDGQKAGLRRDLDLLAKCWKIDRIDVAVGDDWLED
jgi:hypothetical protein